MSYADSLLSTGERVTHRERQHWLVLLWGARLPIVAIVAALLLVVLSQNVTGTARDLLSLLTGVLFVGGLAFLAWATLRYLNQEYILTNRRVIQVEGVVNKRATDSSLEKINDAVLTQSIFGRIFGFGDLDVLTAAEAGIERFRMIVDPIGFKRHMLDAKHEYEVDMERSGWQPSPPIRASTAGSTPTTGSAPTTTGAEAGSATKGLSATTPATPATADPARTAPSASAMSSTPGATDAPGSTSAPHGAHKANADDVTRTLASLADLRDRGAISAEEYEAKKTDLLARL
jgi:hypothetical protein